jgi:hypothetical protein
MTRLSLLLPFVALTACYSEADYAEDYQRISCEKTLECFTEDQAALLDYADVDECLDYFADTIGEVEDDLAGADCTFDKDAAKECISESEALSCEDALGGAYPDACEEICEEWGQ